MCVQIYEGTTLFSKWRIHERALSMFVRVSDQTNRLHLRNEDVLFSNSSSSFILAIYLLLSVLLGFFFFFFFSLPLKIPRTMGRWLLFSFYYLYLAGPYILRVSYTYVLRGTILYLPGNQWGIFLKAVLKIPHIGPIREDINYVKFLTG